MYATSVVSTARGQVRLYGAGWWVLPGYLVCFVLTLLLLGTTPIGTGAGVHQFDLVHPLFSHLHLVNGRVLTHEQLEREGADAQSAINSTDGGPLVGTGTNPGSADGGVGWSPASALHVVGLFTSALWAWMNGEPRLPVGRVEAPPDPPPTSAG